jgi:CubicO group peptidase (beta-lactamase class C family)
MEITNINIEDRMKHYHVIGLSTTLLDNREIRFTRNHGLLETGTERIVDNNSIFSACSISKFLTGLLVMKLTEQNILTLDKDVNEYLLSWRIPVNEFTKNKKVTLRHLLSHQSGIIDPNDSFPELNSTFGVPSIVELLEGKTSYCEIPIKVKQVPGTEFSYSDAGYCIIQQVIEDVTGKVFEEVAKELIFKPLHMNNSTYTITKMDEEYISCGHNKNGKLVDGKYPIYPYPAASGLWSTSTDLAKVIQELMNALIGKSKIGISESTAKEFISPQGSMNWTGLGVFLSETAKGVEVSSLGWGIGFQCMMVALPYAGKGAVIMTNSELGIHQMEGLIGEIYHALDF